MRRMAVAVWLGSVLLLASSGAGLAQGWPPWARNLFGPDFTYEPHRMSPEPPSQREQRNRTDEIRDGGARPAIAAAAPPVVSFPHAFQARSIVVDTGARKLYYVLGDNRAYEYTVGVGREGFGWTGTENISRKQAWPDWHPPAEMRERDPSLPAKMTGGIRNPLGATALYLGETLYRIHGTNDPKSIGRAESSGCIRMLNSNVLHLASVAAVGTPVAVVASLAGQQEVRRARNVVREAVTPSQPPASEAAPENHLTQSIPPPPGGSSQQDHVLPAR